MLIQLILLRGALASIVISSKGDIEPGVLSWGLSTWSTNVINLSQTNANSVVTASFLFNPSTSLDDGVFCVDFPSGFTLSSNCITGVSTESGVDYQASFTSVTLPSSTGVYGPFAIYTRVSQSGSIVDMNQNFGYVYISSSVTSKTLSISFDSLTIQASSTATFTFSITTDIWKFDVFSINIPSSFSLNSPECLGLATGGVQYIVGPDSSNPQTLMCDMSGQTLNIYGISEDIILSDYSLTTISLSVEVSGFTNPSSALSSSSITWLFEIVRQGSLQVIQSFTTTGPQITAATMKVNSWAPVTAQTMVAGKYSYMTLSFTLAHSVPSSGSLHFTFTSVDISTISWMSDQNQGVSGGQSGYYYFSPTISGTCTVTTTTLVCQSFGNDVASGTYSLILLPSLSGTSATATVYSADSSGSKIELSSAFTYTYSTTASALTMASLKFAPDNTATYSAESGSSLIGYFVLKCSVAIPADTTVSLILPINSGGNSELAIGKTSSLKANMINTSTATTSYSGMSANLVLLDDPIVNSNSLSFKIPSLINAGNYVYVYFTSDSSSTLPGLILPYASSNKLTRYEVITSLTISSVEYVWASPITILSAPFASLSGSMLCNSLYSGTVLVLSIQSSFEFTTSLGTVYLSISLSNTYSSDLGSGLAEGDSYPGASSLELSLVLGAQEIIASGFSSITTDAFSIEFPVGEVAANSYSGTVTLYYLASSVEYDIMQSDFTYTISSATPSTFTSSSTAATYVDGAAATPSVSQEFELKVTPLSSSSHTSGYFGVIFPRGYTFNSPSVYFTSAPSTTATVAYSFSSDSQYMEFPSLYIELSGSFSISSSTPTISITGLVAPQGGSTESISFVLASTTGSACANIGISSFTSIATSSLSFTSIVFTPLSIGAYGAGSLSTTVTATLTLPAAISSGSVIKATSNWSLTSSSTCTVTGLSSGEASVSGQNILVTGYDDASSGATVVLTVANVQPPTSSGSSCPFTRIGVYEDSTLERELVDYSGVNVVTVSAASSSGKSSFLEVSVLPNGVGLVADIVYLKFTLAHALPSASSLTIRNPSGTWLLSGSIEKYCWFTLRYSSCSISGAYLTIVLSEPYTVGVILEAYIDKAYTLPSTAGSTSGGFTIQTSFDTISVDSDSESAPSSMQKLTVNSLPSSAITLENSVAISPKTQGELATYVLNFTSTSSLKTSYKIYISFSKNFDPYLGGVVEYKSSDPSTYYQSCSSPTAGLEDMICKADHWMVRIEGIGATISNGTVITIYLYNIRNPSSVGTMGIYVLKNTGDIISYNKNLETDSLSTHGGYVDVKSVSASNTNLRESCEYTLEVYLPDIAINDFIVVGFPRQYNVVRDSGDTVKCEAVVGTWDTGVLSCTVDSNNLMYLSVSTAYSGTDLMTITFTVNNPEWGYDSIPSKFSGQGFDYWTNKFNVAVLRDEKFVYKSYGPNPGYTGFFDPMYPVNINGYSPITVSNFITVKPGTQTVDLLIYVDNYLRADKIVLTPSNLDSNQVTLGFSSSMSFTLTRFMTSISFSVSAPTGSSNSLNYIAWTVTETSLSGTDRYVVSCKTLVEVYDSDSVDLTVRSTKDTTTYVTLGYTSLPIEIYTPNPPATALIISLSLFDSTVSGVTFSPTTFSFSPGDHAKYFTITIDSSFSESLTSSFAYSFIMSGTDTLAFAQIASASFYVISTTTTAPSISSLTFTDQTQTSLSVNLKTGAISLVYWEFCQYDKPFSSLGAIESTVYNLTSTTSTNADLDTQISDYLLGQRSSLYTSETWEHYQKEVYKTSVDTCFSSSVLVSADTLTTVFSPDFLWAGTDYKIQVFATNEFGDYTSQNYSGSTSSMSSPVTMSLSIQDSTSLDSAAVQDAVAESLGVHSSVLTDTSSSRRLSSSYSWTLNIDRSSSTSPDDLYANLDSSILSDKLGGASYQTSKASISSSGFSVASGTFEVQSTSLVYVTMNGSFTGTGKICCIAETSPDTTYTLTDMQVYLGIDRENANVPSNCTEIVSDLTLVVNGLASTTTYLISCLSASSYPVWPSFSSISDFNATTSIETEPFVASFSTVLKLGVLLLISFS